MFLATEGIYGEVLRHPSLVEELQTRYRIVVAGPTTLAAILTSLRMGFQTIAIEESFRSLEGSCRGKDGVREIWGRIG
jgi:DNA recombination protein RmuC